MAFLGSVSWLMLGQYQKIRTITYVIPAGASQLMAEGKDVVNFPSELIFTVGDTLVVDNQDEAVHSFGPFTILPHTTLTKHFERVNVYQNNCTFHQDRQMKLIVQAAMWSIF